MTNPPLSNPVNTQLHPFFFSFALPCRWQREAILEGRGGSREERRKGGRQREVEGGKWSVGSGSSLSPCHSYDSRVIRLINEIIDHLMGLIINCFSTVSCPISSSSSSSSSFLFAATSAFHFFFFIPVLSPHHRRHHPEKMNHFGDLI